MKKKAVFAALVTTLLLSAAAYATADIVPIAGAGSPLAASGAVTVNATVRPKLTLTINTPDAAQSVDFGTVDPGTPTGGKTVNLTVDSNKAFTLAKTVSGQDGLMGLTTSALAAGGAKGSGTAFADAYSINVPWDTTPAAYVANVQYTVTQN